MMVDPVSLVYEAQKLGHVRNNLGLVHIDPRCPIITPYHIGANQLRARVNKHGSCGRGISEVAKDFESGLSDDTLLTAYDLQCHPSRLISKIVSIWGRKLEELKADGFDLSKDHHDIYAQFFNLNAVDGVCKAFHEIGKALNIVDDPDDFLYRILHTNTVFEGAQGVLLDQFHGFHPHTTWSNTTPENALELFEDVGYEVDYEVVGITRTYHTRHGNGPMLESSIKPYYHEHNQNTEFQGVFRYGYADAPLWKYSGEVSGAHGGIDSIMVTHADYFDHYDHIEACLTYQDKDGFFEPAFNPIHCLDTQEAMTSRLKDVEPNTVKIRKPELFRLIEEKLGSKIKYVSEGPETGKQVKYHE